MKIAIYSIAKQEQKNVDRFVKSCEGADLTIVGCDPGDTTSDMLAARGVYAFIVEMDSFRFDAYRNTVLEHLPDDVDICISLDMDETLQDGWRDAVIKAWKNGATRLHYTLVDGSARFLRDRIHARHGYVWKHANHEAVYAFDPLREKIAQCDLVITHHQDRAKDRSKNIALLELAVREEPSSTRMRWYLAREYFMYNELEKSLEEFHEYFDLRSQWAAEKSWAAIFASQASAKMFRDVYAELWLHAAIRFCPDLRDPRFELAKLYFEQERWQEALNEIESAVAILSNHHNFFHSNGAYTELIYEMKARLHKKLGDSYRALLAVKKAQRINPDCGSLIDELKL